MAKIFTTVDGFKLQFTPCGRQWTDGDLVFDSNLNDWPIDSNGEQLDGEISLVHDDELERSTCDCGHERDRHRNGTGYCHECQCGQYRPQCEMCGKYSATVKINATGQYVCRVCMGRRVN